MHRFQSRIAGLACIAISLAGCKNSAGTTGTTTPTPNATVTGLWTGTDSDSGLTLNAIIDAAGDMVVIRSDGKQFVGNLQIAGDTLAAAVDGYANFGSSFPDNYIYGIGTLSGTVTPGVSITATVSITTNNPNGGTSVPGSWALTPGASTSVASSLADVAGNFTVVSPGVPTAAPPVGAIAITASGGMSGQDTTTGCVLSGTISTPDTTINEYQVTYTLASCLTNSNHAVLNGVTFTGLGYLDYSTSPSTLTIAAWGTSTTGSNGIEFGIVSSLTTP